MNEELDRRTFLLGASALVALCPIDLSQTASTASSKRARGKIDSYTVDLANADRKLDIYNVRLRNYGSPGRMPTIPGPLLDRMEVIGFDGYTVAEKVAIARDYLWPRQLGRNGLREGDVGASGSRGPRRSRATPTTSPPRA